MSDASKHPADERNPQLARYKQLRDDHDVPSTESKARDKLIAFRDEINNQKAIYRAAKGILSQTGTVDTSGSNSSSFPNSMGAFGAHNFGSQQKRVSFKTAFNTSSDSGSGADDSDTTSAYAGAFFKKGGIDQVLTESTTSARPLKITGQVIDRFSGNITHWPLFREQFVKLAHRPGNFSDDIKRFYFLLSHLGGQAMKWVSDTPPVKDCYQHAADQLEKEYGHERELYKQLLHKFNLIKPLLPGCSAHQLAEFVKVATNCLAGIASLGKADTTGRSLEKLEEKLPPDLRR